MGLDMYLTKKTFVIPGADNVISISIEGRKLNPKPGRVSEIVEEVGYWRKANAIHKWFVDNVQKGMDDCRQYPVTIDHIKQLLSLVNTVISNHDMAETLLPTQEGFFFGSSEYDQDYFEDLNLTREILANCIQEAEQDKASRIYYQSSW